MYKYRNVKTGIEFESVTKCAGDNIEEITEAIEKKAAPKRKRPAKGAKNESK